MNLASKLKHCRTQQHLTQADVADQLHVSRKTISGWENNRSYPDLNSLIALSDIYKVPTDDLLRDERFLENIEEQRKTHTRILKISKFSFILNIFFFLLGYVEFFRLFGIHTLAIPVLSIVNIILLFSYYPYWTKFSRRLRILGAILVFITIFLLNTALNILDPYFSDYFSTLDSSMIAGLAVGRIILITIISLSGTGILFFNPFKHVL